MCHQCCRQGDDPFPPPAGQTASGAGQEAAGSLGQPDTQLSCVHRAVDQHPQVLFCSLLFSGFPPHWLSLQVNSICFSHKMMNFYATDLTHKKCPLPILTPKRKQHLTGLLSPFLHFLMGSRANPNFLLVQTPPSFISIITRGPPSYSGPPVMKKSMVSTGSGDRKLTQPHHIPILSVMPLSEQ